MATALVSFLYGSGLALLFAFGQSMAWQSMKKGTILASGSFTLKYGTGIAAIITVLGLVAIVEVGLAVRWWLILSLGVMYFLGGWIATLLERGLYGNEATIQTIVFGAKQWARDQGQDAALRIVKSTVPKWWGKLMSPRWQRELEASLSQVWAATEARKRLHSGSARE